MVFSVERKQLNCVSTEQKLWALKKLDNKVSVQRGVVDDSGEQFVAYFLPAEETMKKRKRDAESGVEYDDDDIYEYKMAREYNWNVKNKASKGYEENYFFVCREGNIYYNELETRVRLNKRRLKPGAQPNSNSKLVVRHRPLDEAEYKTQVSYSMAINNI
ncbi:UNVERIFIED_CONTAM: paf1 [Trichonephila clavipes]